MRFNIVRPQLIDMRPQFIDDSCQKKAPSTLIVVNVNKRVICFLKVGHVAIVCIENLGMPCGLCILNICICMYRGLCL